MGLPDISLKNKKITTKKVRNQKTNKQKTHHHKHEQKVANTSGLSFSWMFTGTESDCWPVLTLRSRRRWGPYRHTAQSGHPGAITANSQVAFLHIYFPYCISIPCLSLLNQEWLSFTNLESYKGFSLAIIVWLVSQFCLPLARIWLQRKRRSIPNYKMSPLPSLRWQIAQWQCKQM